MKRLSQIFTLFAAVLLMTAACKKDDTVKDEDVTPKKYKYVLMTMSDRTVQDKPGYITAFDSLPDGNVSNITTNSVSGKGMGGFRTYKNWFFKTFANADYSKIIERLQFSADGKISVENQIAVDQSTFGSGNFVVADDNSGFYWDGAEPLKIQTFNPASLSRTGSIDFESVVNERGVDEAAILFRSIGQKFLAVKNGKLFANITYAKTNAAQKGFFDDFYEDVYIAVIDVATGKYEKTITIPNTGSIAYINENEMYDFDTNGDLYIVCQGRSALGGKSKIARIKANATDIDATWELNFSDFRAEDNGKFVGVFAKDGKLIVVLNTETLTGGGTGNINTGDIWKFYTVDVASKTFTAINGIPAGTNPGAALAVVEIDGKILLRGSTADGSVNGYFEYNPASISATQLFQVTEGGSVNGFYKVEVK